MKIKAKVYTRDGCMQCEATKKVLERFNIEVEMINITGNKELENKFIKMGYKSLPVVIINNKEKTSWSGFRPDIISQINK